MKKLWLLFLLGSVSLFAFEHLSADNFDAKINDKNVIVDFYHTW